MDIFKASQSGNLETLQKLLEDDIDPNIKNSYGETALIYASWNGHIPCVEELLDNNVDPNTR